MLIQIFQLLYQILIIFILIYQIQRIIGNCASVMYFMTVEIHGLKFEHDRLNHSEVPWKLRSLCHRILFFLRNSLVAEYSRIEFLRLPLRNSALCPFIQQSFVTDVHLLIINLCHYLNFIN